MKYHKITEWDVANGIGIGVVLWVSGCEHKCTGCHNFMTWDADSGIEFTEYTLQRILSILQHPYVNRLTLSGGDPLAVYNRDSILQIVKSVRGHYPNKKIWCYTGYKYEDICDLEVINYLDVLVDGKFEENNKDVGLFWCGSTNQRVIDIKSTKSTGIITQI